MQITIHQAEIETAIRNHIKSLITVRDGVEIKIDLAATRGPEGYRATIDIAPGKATTTTAPVVQAADPADRASHEQQAVQAEEAPVAQAPVATPAPADAVPAVAPAPKAPISFARKTIVAPTPTEVPAPASSNVTSFPASGIEHAEEAAAEAPATVQVAEAVTAAEPAPVRNSLFKGLKKPSNS